MINETKLEYLHDFESRLCRAVLSIVAKKLEKMNSYVTPADRCVISSNTYALDGIVTFDVLLCCSQSVTS